MCLIGPAGYKQESISIFKLKGNDKSGFGKIVASLKGKTYHNDYRGLFDNLKINMGMCLK